MANYVSSSSHSHSLSCSDFEDTSFWNELNLPSLLQIENELYTLLEPSVEGEQVIDAEPVAQVVPPVLPKPLEEVAVEEKKNTPVKKTLCDSRTITKEMISSYFHLPISEAAVQLKVGVTTLKNRCRILGISRWPRIKLLKLEDEDDKEIPISSPEQDYRPFFNHAENPPLDYHFNNPTSSPTGKTLHQIQQSCCSAEQLDFDWGLVNDMLCGQNDVSLEAPPVVPELSNSTEIIVFDKRTSKHWGLNTISKFFHLPAAQAARELNVSDDKLKRMCTKLGIKRWPYRKLQSMDNLLENLQYLSKDKTYAVNKEKVIELQKEKERMLKDPNIELRAETQVIRESSRKKRRYQHLMDIAHAAKYDNSWKLHGVKSEVIDEPP